MTDKKKGSIANTSGRKLKVMVKTARGRTVGQVRWLQRQLNDPYVKEAQSRGYRSRAAFKLIELDDKHKLIRKGGRIVDLGAAPGGWTQVAVERAGTGATVVGLDINPMEPVPGAEILQLDFLTEDAPEKLKAVMGGEADVVLSDMAAPATGHRATDHMKIMALCETALMFAEEVLKPGGAFVCKVQRGGTEAQLLNAMKKNFKSVAHVKPPASRADSAEMYVVALGFRGRSEAPGG
ncbi:Ribosomal RNA large subunit methyltransferase E [Alphaproteobacteria bacterium SO-S41]|nr:Ribosomal RNA large subunit methyltransferase E [Alphaproteobacteria bacterium SO-S41]